MSLEKDVKSIIDEREQERKNIALEEARLRKEEKDALINFFVTSIDTRFQKLKENVVLTVNDDDMYASFDYKKITYYLVYEHKFHEDHGLDSYSYWSDTWKLHQRARYGAREAFISARIEDKADWYPEVLKALILLDGPEPRRGW